MKPVELDLDHIPSRPRKRADKNKAPFPRRAAAWRRMVRSLRIDGPQTIKALAKNLVLRETDVARLMRWFINHGAVERVGRKYRLTEKWADFGKPAKRRPATPKPNAWTKIAADED